MSLQARRIQQEARRRQMEEMQRRQQEYYRQQQQHPQQFGPPQGYYGGNPAQQVSKQLLLRVSLFNLMLFRVVSTHLSTRHNNNVGEALVEEALVCLSLAVLQVDCFSEKHSTDLEVMVADSVVMMEEEAEMVEVEISKVIFG